MDKYGIALGPEERVKVSKAILLTKPTSYLQHGENENHRTLKICTPFRHVKRIKTSFAGLEVELVDRERALAQIKEFGERGTFPVYVVYGPEGCGKTAFLKQAKAVLEEEFGYHVLYANPLAKRIEEIFQYSPTAKELVEKAFSVFSDPLAKAVDLVINVAG